VIDLRILRNDPELARQAQRRRDEPPELIDEILQRDESRRTAIAHFEKLRAEQKTMGKEVAKAGGDDKADLLATSKRLSIRVKEAEVAQTEAEQAFVEAMTRLPNIAAPEAPAGGEDDYVVLEHVGDPRDFAAEGFEPLDHVELGKRLGAIDIERGAKVSGARFYYLTGIGADLELALVGPAHDGESESLAGAVESGIERVDALHRRLARRDDEVAALDSRPVGWAALLD